MRSSRARRLEWALSRAGDEQAGTLRRTGRLARRLAYHALVVELRARRDDLVGILLGRARHDTIEERHQPSVVIRLKESADAQGHARVREESHALLGLQWQRGAALDRRLQPGRGNAAMLPRPRTGVLGSILGKLCGECALEGDALVEARHLDLRRQAGAEGEEERRTLGDSRAQQRVGRVRRFGKGDRAGGWEGRHVGERAATWGRGRADGRAKGSTVPARVRWTRSAARRGQGTRRRRATRRAARGHARSLLPQARTRTLRRRTRRPSDRAAGAAPWRCQAQRAATGRRPRDRARRPSRTATPRPAPVTSAEWRRTVCVCVEGGKGGEAGRPRRDVRMLLPPRHAHECAPPRVGQPAAP